jgi:hypothetical protein
MLKKLLLGVSVNAKITSKSPLRFQSLGMAQPDKRKIVYPPTNCYDLGCTPRTIHAREILVLGERVNALSHKFFLHQVHK